MFLKLVVSGNETICKGKLIFLILQAFFYIFSKNVSNRKISD